MPQMLWVVRWASLYADLLKYVPSCVQVSEALRKESLYFEELMDTLHHYHLHHHLQITLLLQRLLKDCVGAAEGHWFQTI